MKKTSIIVLLICLLLVISCGSDHESKGTAYFGGVEIVFDFDNKKITLNNHNNTVVKVNIQNLSNGSVLSADIITWPGSSDNKENLIFNKGELVEIKIWQGYASVFYGNILASQPDYIGQATLSEGTIIVYPTSNQISYVIPLPITNGAFCELSGQYNPNNPLDQASNLLFCKNVSTDLIEVQLYLLKPALPTGYEADFEIGSMWVYWEDATDLGIIYNIPEALALQVTSYDLLDNDFKRTEIFGFLLNISTNSYSQISTPITLP